MRAAKKLLEVDPVVHETFYELAGDKLDELKYDLKQSKGLALTVIHPTQGYMEVPEFKFVFEDKLIVNHPSSQNDFKQEVLEYINTKVPGYITNLKDKLMTAKQYDIPIIWGLEVKEYFERNPKYLVESVERVMTIIGHDYLKSIGKVYFYPSNWTSPRPIQVSWRDADYFLPEWIKLLKKQVDLKHSTVVGQQFNANKMVSCVNTWRLSSEKAGVKCNVLPEATFGYDY